MNDLTSSGPGDLVERFALPPAEIEQRSLAIVSSALGELFRDDSEREVAARIVYAAGDLDVGPLLRFANDAVSTGVQALKSGAEIIVDVRMVAAGIDQARVRELGCTLHCAIDEPGTEARARERNVPRSVEAMRALLPHIDKSVVAIGNAPTALLSLLDLIDLHSIRPSLVIGMPVGFVAAAESKEELAKRAIPSLTVTGSRGGSPLAAAAVNALLRFAAPSHVGRDRTRTAVLFAGHGSRAPAAAAAMLGAVENVRNRGTFPIVETGYLEMSQPDIPEALRLCVEQGALRVLVVPYFLHTGMHILRDIPAVLRREAGQYPGLTVSMGRAIGLHADLANVMLAGALEAEALPDIRTVEAPSERAIIAAGTGGDE